MLTLNDRGRVVPGRQKISAVCRTVDFDETFRTAADRTNLTAEGWARALGLPLVANGTQHGVANRPEEAKCQLSSINDPVA
jgi:hypothetical protein